MTIVLDQPLQGVTAQESGLQNIVNLPNVVKDVVGITAPSVFAITRLVWNGPISFQQTFFLPLDQHMLILPGEPK